MRRVLFVTFVMSMIVGKGIGQSVVVGQLPLGGALSNGPQAPVAKSSISGSVVKATTGDAISGVQVTLTRVAAAPNAAAAGARGANTPATPGQPAQQSAQAQQQNLNIIPAVRTDDQGRFLLPDVPPGTYRISATRNGYAQQQFGQRSVGRPGTVVSVSAGQQIKDIAFRLIPAGTIVGRVTDAKGEPLPGVAVQALRSTYDSTGKHQLQPVANAKTNDLGEYRLYWLNPGRYYLNANAAPQGLEALTAMTSRAAAAQGGPSSPEEAQAMAQAQSILGPGKNPNEETDPGFVTMFYPNTTDTSRASTVDLTPGAELRGIDFTLIRDHKVQIRGKIVDASSGKPPEMAQVSVTLRDSAGSAVDILGALGGALQGNSYNPTTGEFEIKEVSTGRYFLQVMSQTKVPPPAAGNAPVNTADALEQISSLNNISVPVDVYDADVENMQVTVTPGVTIPGRLRLEGTPPPDPNANANANRNPNLNQNQNLYAQFTVSLVSTAGGGSSILALLGGGGGGKPAADGTFSLPKIAPGDYKVSISGMGRNMFLKEARLDQKDILGGVTIGDRISGTLELTLSRSGAEVDATVTDSAAKAVSGIQVVVIPEMQRERHELYKTGLTDQEGKVVIRALTPGDYRLFAWEDIEPFSYFDADILRQYEQQGKVIHARESARETVEMKIIPASAP